MNKRHNVPIWYSILEMTKKSASIPNGVEVVRQSLVTISVIAISIKIATTEALKNDILNVFF